jgi:hypothetical protein
MRDGHLRVRKPRCFLVYALAPDNLSAADANRLFNEFVADQALPLVLFHDHFIGKPGGLAIFFAETPEEREALFNHQHLTDWHIEYRLLIFSYNPAAFDEQTAYTLRQYRNADWETLRCEKRPAYGNPVHEAETAEES